VTAIGIAIRVIPVEKDVLVEAESPAMADMTILDPGLWIERVETGLVTGKTYAAPDAIAR